MDTLNTFSWASLDVSFSDLVTRYSSIPIFQDAEGDELLIHRSPYRRPLRCHDNRALDFERPLGRDMLTSNSALAAGRLLINIYESDTVLLPKAQNAAHHADYAAFYATDTRMLGAAIRPTLERHLFGFLDASAGAYEPCTARHFQAHLAAVEHTLVTREHQPALSVASLYDRERLAKFLLLQHTPHTVFASPLVRQGVIGAVDPAVAARLAAYTTAAFAAVEQEQRAFVDILRAFDLSHEPHVYWQFYMPSSLLYCTFLHYLARDSAQVLRFVGGLTFALMCLAAEVQARDVMLRDLFGDSATSPSDGIFSALTSDRLGEFLQPLVDVYGAPALAEIYRGFEDAREVRRIAIDSVFRHLNWGSRLDTYAESARQLFRRIQAGEIDTPLETYVEVCSERSTTHVHDDHRLLVIESGSMDFWPNFGEPRRMDAGDVMLVPLHCLHGSVVRSDQCVYHQPLVSRSMMEALDLPT